MAGSTAGCANQSRPSVLLLLLVLLPWPGQAAAAATMEVAGCRSAGLFCGVVDQQLHMALSYHHDCCGLHLQFILK